MRKPARKPGKRAAATVRKRGKPHPPEVVVAAMGMLVAGASIEEVSQKLDVPKQTLSEWKKKIPPEFGQVRTKRENVTELLTQYLESALRAQIAQLQVFSDEKWLKRQNASELATLHGVLHDKSIRVYEAARLGAQQQYPEQSIAEIGPGEEDREQLEDLAAGDRA